VEYSELEAAWEAQKRLESRFVFAAPQHLEAQQARQEGVKIKVAEVAHPPMPAPASGVDEVNGRIRERLQNVDPAIGDFVEKNDIRIVNRTDSFWNRFAGAADLPVRKVDENGHVYHEIAVDEGLSEYERLKLLSRLLRRNEEFKKFEKENYRYNPDHLSPAPGSAEYPAYLQRLRQDAVAWARAAGATEAEISNAQSAENWNAAMGPGGFFWTALELFAAAKARRGGARNIQAQQAQEQAMRNYLDRTAPRHVIPAESKIERPGVFIERAPRKPSEISIKPLSQNEQQKRVSEGRSAFRLELALPGTRLERSNNPYVDYFDQYGRSYELMGNVGTVPFWSKQRGPFMAQIDKHLEKADILAIDLTGFPDHIKREVKTYIDGLPPDQRARIVRIGF